MLQGIAGMLEFLGISPFWPILVGSLSIIWSGLSAKEMKYKIEEKTNKDGNKEYRVFKYK